MTVEEELAKFKEAVNALMDGETPKAASWWSKYGTAVVCGGCLVLGLVVGHVIR